MIQPSKNELSNSYNKTLRDARTELSAPEKVLSSIIHNPFNETVLNVLTFLFAARPFMYGLLGAFLITVFDYVFARLGGSPFIVILPLIAFIIGWLTGIVTNGILFIGRKK